MPINIDRSANWSMANEGYIRVTLTDYLGVPYQVWRKPQVDYGKLWGSFVRSFRTGVEYTDEIGGGELTMAEGRQETLITIENEKL